MILASDLPLAFGDLPFQVGDLPVAFDYSAPEIVNFPLRNVRSNRVGFGESTNHHASADVHGSRQSQRLVLGRGLFRSQQRLGGPRVVDRHRVGTQHEPIP